MSENSTQKKNTLLQSLLSPASSKLTQDVQIKEIVPRNLINKKPTLKEGKNNQNNSFLFDYKNNFYDLSNNQKNAQINNISNYNIYHFNLKNSPKKYFHKKLLKKIIPGKLTKRNIDTSFNLNKNSFFINKNVQVEKLYDTQVNLSNFNTITAEGQKNSFCGTKFENVRENKSCLFFCGINKKNSYFYEPKSTKNIKKKKTKDNLDKISIPCINCGNLIQMDEIEKHSLKCNNVSYDILEVDLTNNETNCIDYKLTKLKEYINKLENSINENEQFLEEDKYLILIIKDYIEKVLKINQANISNIKELKNICKNFSMLNIKYNKSLNYLILMDRTKNLIVEKLKIFKESIKNEKTRETYSSNSQYNSIYENKIINKKKELEKITNEMKYEKIKVKNLRKSKGAEHKNKISKFQISQNFTNKNDLFQYETKKSNQNLQIKTYNEKENNIINDKNEILFNSPKSKIEKELSNIQSSMTSVRTPKNNKLQLSLDSDSINNSRNYSSLSCRNNNRKLFLKTVVQIKFEKLHNSHKGQKISPKMIWKEAKKQNINSNLWGKFIFNELNHPKKYVNNRNENKRKPLTHSMSVINEEL